MTKVDALRRDVGQLLWIGFEGTQVSAELGAALAAGDAGGVILFARNLPRTVAGGAEVADLGGITELVTALHREGAKAGDPLLVAIDQEGGRVQRVGEPATVWPPMLNLSRADDARAESLAEAAGEALGRELGALGIDVDFAPVLDVHTNPANPVIGDRAFATEPAAVAVRALAFARGLARAGVLSCGKHFPGHGDTVTDSHLDLPRLDHDLDRLRAIELEPFRRAGAAGLPMIMTAHVVFSALDPDVPATLSPRVLKELLRQELGYRGLVVSDDLDMNAISNHYGVGEAAVTAVLAGCDALLLCRDPAHQEAAREALIRAAETRPAVRERVAAAAAAVRALKREHAAARPAPLSPDQARAVLGADAHRRLAAELAAL